MLEELALVLIVVALFAALLYYFNYIQKKLVEDAQRMVVSARARMAIAERKFMQGKIKKNVFDALADDLEQERISAELVLFRFKKTHQLSVDSKAFEILSRMERPTKYRRAKIEHILKETELLREEMVLLESKLLRRDIKQSVFEKLIKEKEFSLIKKEKELMDVVELASDPAKRKSKGLA